MSVETRRFGPSDWEAYREIRLEALAREPHVFATGWHQDAALTPEQWRERLDNPDSGTFALIDEGKPVGLATWFLPPQANAHHRGMIVGVYLRQSHRGRGLSRTLLQAVLAEAETRSDDLALNVLAENAPAIGLYESLGFRIVATVPGALKHAGRYYDEHLMLRPGPA